jgi:salicylate hydroxylase
MPASRNILVAGAGIGGLTAALALARSGFRVTLLERAERLEEAGAGIQLSPNATRVLIALGLADRLCRTAVAPQAIAIHTASGGRLARIPLGDAVEQRYGAPYWSIHRGDLQAALLETVHESPDVDLKLGTKVEDFVVHAHGVSAACRRASSVADEHGIALVCADGLWSGLRQRLGRRGRPEFRGRTAWRALVPAEHVEPEFRSNEVQLWLGQNAHLVHYPVKSGALINVVAIVGDQWSEPGWIADGVREELLTRYSPWNWAEPVREFLALPERWQKWALYDIAPLRQWGEGPVTLLGDAAHPMLPFLAQGAAMAIEDAAVLAANFAQRPTDPAAALRQYERARRRRTARVQRAAHSNGRVYHLGAAEAVLRNFALRVAGGSMLLRRYNWLYDWRAPAIAAVNIDTLPSPRAGEGANETA